MKLSQSGTLLILFLDAFWMSCCFMDGLGCAGALEWLRDPTESKGAND